ncbi:carboxymuconolactone decarboxylase family protein [Chachezhania sediminis]|uniref:carboxymuconolactone decarboxylase family protein n=1 Tax=Chachezhania sediminis TaxID=2599291 RepID=UPI00131AECAE|nr:carboxymuconolactone decarboxylase family protein [Chachezhania sediminis]
MSLEDDLADLKAKRGYLLPHHGLLAMTAPNLLKGYDAAYTALALEDRVLSHHDREFVWLAILIATDEEIATHHIEKFHKAGGTADEVSAVLRVTATVCGFRAYRFTQTHWSDHLPEVDIPADWTRAVVMAGQGADPVLVHMAACAVQICRADWEGLRWQLRDAYAAGVDEMWLSEALSLTMFPASVPYFVTAAKIWREMIRSGELQAGERFRTWATFPGQGGHGGGPDD